MAKKKKEKETSQFLDGFINFPCWLLVTLGELFCSLSSRFSSFFKKEDSIIKLYEEKLAQKDEQITQLKEQNTHITRKLTELERKKDQAAVLMDQEKKIKKLLKGLDEVMSRYAYSFDELQKRVSRFEFAQTCRQKTKEEPIKNEQKLNPEKTPEVEEDPKSTFLLPKLVQFASVICFFKKGKDDELSLIAGEILTILDEPLATWAYCRNVLGEEGLVPTSHIEKFVPLERQPWVYSGMEKEEATKLLQNATDGEFLLLLGTTDYLLVKSFWRVKSIKVEFKCGKVYIGQNCFPNINALLIYHVATPLHSSSVENIRLTKPLIDENRVECVEDKYIIMERIYKKLSGETKIYDDSKCLNRMVEYKPQEEFEFVQPFVPACINIVPYSTFVPITCETVSEKRIETFLNPVEPWWFGYMNQGQAEALLANGLVGNYMVWKSLNKERAHFISVRCRDKVRHFVAHKRVVVKVKYDKPKRPKYRFEGKSYDSLNGIIAEYSTSAIYRTLTEEIYLVKPLPRIFSILEPIPWNFLP